MSDARVFAYVRVSTDDQKTEGQELSVLRYADEQGLKIYQWFKVDCSSRKTLRERRIDELLNQVAEDDLLLVPELSRLGRSVGQVITIMDEFVRKKVTVICIKENLRLNGQRDIQSKIMITLLGLFAEIERDLISERTKEGLARARAEGKLLGRPKGKGRSKLDNHDEEIVSLLKTGSSKSYLARKYKVTPPTLYNWLRKHQITITPNF